MVKFNLRLGWKLPCLGTKKNLATLLVLDSTAIYMLLLRDHVSLFAKLSVSLSPCELQEGV